MLEMLLYTKGLTDSETLIFHKEYNERKKSPATAVALAIFLGGLGAHRFYLSQYWQGALYILFCWTFIPALIAVVEAFLLSSRVRKYNESKAQEIALSIKAIRHEPLTKIAQNS